MKYRCLVCGAIIDTNVRCPICGAGPDMIVPYEEGDELKTEEDKKE
jgi:ribosomal protein S27E